MFRARNFRVKIDLPRRICFVLPQVILTTKGISEMRKIVICMDGTGNEIGDSETNVLKFYRSLVQDETQKTHYILGVGAYDRQSLLYRPLQKLQGVMGLAFGLGLEDDVLEAYRWLCRTYQTAQENAPAPPDVQPEVGDKEEPEDDQIYILGFSRGSYAARVLAGFINNFGLIKENDLHLIPAVFRAYRRITSHDADKPDNVRFKALRQYEDVLRPEHVSIRALGLFDTVSSMIRFGRPWVNLWKYQSLFELGTHANVVENPSVRIVMHAMSIDEHRSLFRALHWQKGDYFGNRFRSGRSQRTQFVRQRWFPGYHSDIGGSPREDQAGIGKITALWLLDALEQADKDADAEDNTIRAEKGDAPLPGGETRPAGLRLKRGNKEVYFLGETYANYKTTNPGGYRYSGPDPRAPLHNSVFESGFIPRWSWFWLPLEVLIKAIQRREPGRPALIRRGLIWYFPFLEPRRIPDGDEIDDSAFIRRDDAACHYKPRNLPHPTPPHLKRSKASEPQ